MGIVEDDGVPGIEGVSSPVSNPRGGPMILERYSSKSLSSGFGGGVLPLKSEMSGPGRGGTERCRAYEGCATVSLELALGFGLAHLLELGPFGEDFRPPFVGHDGSERSSDRPVGYPGINYHSLLFCSPFHPFSSVYNGSRYKLPVIPIFLRFSFHD